MISLEVFLKVEMNNSSNFEGLSVVKRTVKVPQGFEIISFEINKILEGELLSGGV